MKYFYGAGRRGPYFEGWYLKHQAPGGAALAVIPSLHITGAGEISATLQVITPQGSWQAAFPQKSFHARPDMFQVWVGKNLFSRKNIWLDLDIDGLSLHGELHYGPFTPLKSDIMGPLRHVPFLQCSHGVLSMGHRLEGILTLNGTQLDFTGGTGYIETDRGSAFPRAYLWTQCAWKEERNNSLMLSIAEIPFPGHSFTGCICAVLCGGKAYRLATYQGARIEGWSAQGAVIRQGPFRLAAELLEPRAQPLAAPVDGAMGRTVHESLCADVRYRFWKDGALLFEHVDAGASFEYAGGEDLPLTTPPPYPPADLNCGKSPLLGLHTPEDRRLF